MKVIFLGCGYLGHNLSKLLKNKYDVEMWGIDSPYVKYTPWFKPVDVFNMAEMVNQDFEDAVIIDTVSLVSVRTVVEDEDKFLKDLVHKYDGLMDVLKAKGAKRYIYFSSGGAIYGDSDHPSKETDELNPKSFYGKTKKVIENVVQSSGVNYLIVRPSNPYGGFQLTNGQGVIPILIDKCLRDDKFSLYNSIETGRDYFFIDDFAKALEILIDKDVNKEIVNIGSGESTSLKTVIETVEEKCNKKINIEICNFDQNAVKDLVLNIDKLKSYGYEASVNLDEGIQFEVDRIKNEMENK